jgi:hypothetical protein
VYSSNSVAAIVVLTVFAALVVGFLVGYYVNSRRYLRCLHHDGEKRLWNLVGKASGSNGGCMLPKRVNQNPYEIDPLKYQFGAPAYKCETTIIGGGGGGGPPNGFSSGGDDCDAFEPILQRNVGSRCIDEIKLNNMRRTPDEEGDDSPPRPPPRRNRSIRKHPDG